MSSIDPDDDTPEDQAEDLRADRPGFNPVMALLLIVLLGLAAYTIFAVMT